MRRAALLLALLALGVAPALASEERPTLADLEKELVCPTCNTTLDMSDSPQAHRMRVFIRERIEAGDSKSEIKADLVEMLGEGVLAAPPKRGFDLLAWLLPLGGLAAASAAVGLLAWRWSTRRAPADDPWAALEEPSTNGHAALDAELERRLDEELARFEP